MVDEICRLTELEPDTRQTYVKYKQLGGVLRHEYHHVIFTIEVFRLVTKELTNL